MRTDFIVAYLRTILRRKANLTINYIKVIAVVPITSFVELFPIIVINLKREDTLAKQRVEIKPIRPESQ